MTAACAVAGCIRGAVYGSVEFFAPLFASRQKVERRTLHFVKLLLSHEIASSLAMTVTFKVQEFPGRAQDDSTRSKIENIKTESASVE